MSPRRRIFKVNLFAAKGIVDGPQPVRDIYIIAALCEDDAREIAEENGMKPVEEIRLVGRPLMERTLGIVWPKEKVSDVSDEEEKYEPARWMPIGLYCLKRKGLTIGTTFHRHFLVAATSEEEARQLAHDYKKPMTDALDHRLVSCKLYSRYSTFDKSHVLYEYRAK